MILFCILQASRGQLRRASEDAQRHVGFASLEGRGESVTSAGITSVAVWLLFVRLVPTRIKVLLHGSR